MAYTHQDSPSDAVDPKTLPPLDLPAGIPSRYVDTTPYSLIFHILESLPTNHTNPTSTPPKLILCCHGFPEIAYSWRKILPLLSAAGYHAVAFDQRGYGRTHSPTPLTRDSFRPLNLLKDTLALVHALGYTSVAAVVGHDFGAVTAHLCALARPDIFHSLVLMSHPTKGAPALPTATSPSANTFPTSPRPAKETPIQDQLAALSPPRQHYKYYYCTPPANDNMTHPVGQPLHTFLRGYFHLKSADWDVNKPHPLPDWSGKSLEVMPHYYIMDLNTGGMRENVSADMAKENAGQVAERARRWLPDSELATYVQEYGRVSFQGGLNWYGLQTNPAIAGDVYIFSGKKVEVPTVFVSGKSDWGTYQEPGAVEAMENGKSVKGDCYRGTVLVEGAGHWVNQEQAGRCVEEILKVAGEIEGGKGRL
jgi:pimeloyl-ACP methyl ester carboxylesterase